MRRYLSYINIRQPVAPRMLGVILTVKNTFINLIYNLPFNISNNELVLHCDKQLMDLVRSIFIRITRTLNKYLLFDAMLPIQLTQVIDRQMLIIELLIE